MSNAKPLQAATPPTPAELDAMSPFDRFKWNVRHVMSAPKDATTNPFKIHQSTPPTKPPHTAGD